MLNVNDYKKYDLRTTRNSALQKAKYYLGKWGRIEKNFSKLNADETKIAQRLFTTLKKMTQGEREFLADKYRVLINDVENPSKIYHTDIEVAERYGMAKSEYVELRKGIEYKFYHYLKELL